MSIHRSLVPKNALKRSRNVLTRAERVAKLKEDGHWTEGRSVFGLPKVAPLKKLKKRKAKKKVEETVEGAETAGSDAAEKPATKA